MLKLLFLHKMECIYSCQKKNVEIFSTFDKIDIADDASFLQNGMLLIFVHCAFIGQGFMFGKGLLL